jgi:signal transduction histidine kinase
MSAIRAEPEGNARRIVLIDDHAWIRKSLRQLLELGGDFEVVGEGANGAEAVERVEELDPDLVLMDMNMPIMNGAEATKVIKERHPEIKVLALTAFADMSLVSAMVKAGASGYLLKGGSSEELLESLNAVAGGSGALDKKITKDVMEDMAELYKKEQERADALAELDRMKSEFVSVISHELRTPVTTLKGGVLTLRKNWQSIDGGVRAELLDSMARQCDKLTQMIGQILTVSGIQRGGVGLKPTEFPLSEVASDALEMVKEKAAGRSIELRADDSIASGDRSRITEVAASIIENALHFTVGAVAIEVSADGDVAILSVADEGPGMTEQTLGSLLNEPFTQADSSSTRPVGGLGLSLYIARQVLEACGGRLEVETGPERGSKFTMALPRPPSHPR